MKLKLLTAAVLLCSASLCNVQAQSLSSILSKAKSVISSLTGTSSNSLTGTWVYEGADINFSSDNILAKAGGTLASSKIESQINNILKKYGLAPSNLTLTFADDSTYTGTLKANSAKSMKGTYTYADNKLTLTPSLSKKSISTTAKVGSSLELTCNADKLLSLIQGLSSVSSASTTLSTLSSLAKNYTGMQIGLKFKKQ